MGNPVSGCGGKRSKHGSAGQCVAVAALAMMVGGARAAEPMAAKAPVRQPPIPASPAPLSTEELLRRLSCMEQRVRTLESQKAVVPAVAVAPTSMAPPGQQVGPQPVVGARVPHQSTPPVESEPAAGAAMPARGETAGPWAPVVAGPAAPIAGAPAPPITLPIAPPVNASAMPTPAAKQRGDKPKTAAKAAPGDPCAPVLPAQAGSAGTQVSVMPGAAGPVPAGAPVGTRPAALPPGVPAGMQVSVMPGAEGLLPGQPPQPGAGVASAGAPPNTGLVGVASSPVEALSFGGYGEILFGRQQNPEAGGKWQNGFDARRVVLSPAYALSKNIIFNAEIEWEHGGFAADADDKLAGSIDVEQLFVDFKITSWFNWRAPGIDLVPIGYINEHHEPNQFYSVKRPELYLGIIPSTWRQPGTRFYGLIGHGFSYDVQISQSIEDFGSGFSNRTGANRVADGPYDGGFSGKEALGLSRTPVGDFRQLNNQMAYTGRLEYQPPWLPGFAGSGSIYYTGNTTPRGAHTDAGDRLGTSSLTMLDVEGRWRVPKTGLELRGEVVQVRFGNATNLRANNDGDDANNIGKTMYGYSGEIAYHLPLGTILESAWEVVPFYRYTNQNLQTKGFAGSDDNAPTGAGQTTYHTAGLAVVPSKKVQLKVTYGKVVNHDPAGARSDYVLGGVGFQF